MYCDFFQMAVDDFEGTIVEIDPKNADDKHSMLSFINRAIEYLQDDLYVFGQLTRIDDFTPDMAELLLTTSKERHTLEDGQRQIQLNRIDDNMHVLCRVAEQTDKSQKYPCLEQELKKEQYHEHVKSFIDRVTDIVGTKRVEAKSRAGRAFKAAQRAKHRAQQGQDCSE